MRSDYKRLVRFGMVGSGSISAVHLAALARTPRARLAAIFSIDQSSARGLALSADGHRASRGKRIFVSRSLDEFLAPEADIDAVLIGSPTGMHAEGVTPALQSGKHVLCEMPLEICIERVVAMRRQAEQNGVRFGALLPARTKTDVRSIRRAVENKLFGTISLLSARIKASKNATYYSDSPWRGKKSLAGGGALMTQGIYAADLLSWLGGPVAEVSAFSAQLVHNEIETEDAIAVALRFQSGALGSIDVATSSFSGYECRLEILGDRGFAVIVNDRLESCRFLDMQAWEAGLESISSLHKCTQISTDAKSGVCRGYQMQIAGFCEAILGYDNSSDGFVEAGDAAEAVAIVETAYKSVKSKRIEPLPFLK